MSVKFEFNSENEYVEAIQRKKEEYDRYLSLMQKEG